MPTKKCIFCDHIKETNEFYLRKRDGHLLRSICKQCDKSNRRRYADRWQTSDAATAWRRTYIATRRKTDPYGRMLAEARRCNKRNMNCNDACDITADNLRSLFINGCRYCGNDNVARYSIDRIDNTKPYSLNNINPSCIECNLTRGTMPIEVWIKFLAPGMRHARSTGALDTWIRCKKTGPK